MSNENPDIAALLNEALADARLGQRSYGWSYDGQKLAARIEEIVEDLRKAGRTAASPAPALTFEKWFAKDELENGCRGTSQLERDQMEASWNGALVYGCGGKSLDERIIVFAVDLADERARFEEWAGNPPVELEQKDSDPDSFWCWQAWKAAVGLSPSVRGPRFLSTLRFAAVKDHIIAITVNKLRRLAQDFHNHGSLRDRIAYAVVPLLKEEVTVPIDSPSVAQKQSADLGKAG